MKRKMCERTTARDVLVKLERVALRWLGDEKLDQVPGQDVEWLHVRELVEVAQEDDLVEEMVSRRINFFAREAGKGGRTLTSGSRVSMLATKSSTTLAWAIRLLTDPLRAVWTRPMIIRPHRSSRQRLKHRSSDRAGERTFGGSRPALARKVSNDDVQSLLLARGALDNEASSEGLPRLDPCLVLGVDESCTTDYDRVRPGNCTPKKMRRLTWVESKGCLARLLVQDEELRLVVLAWRRGRVELHSVQSEKHGRSDVAPCRHRTYNRSTYDWEERWRSKTYLADLRLDCWPVQC